MKKTAIAQYFDPALVARRSFPAGDDLLRSSKQDLTSRWYTGVQGVDFFTWQDLRGNFIKAQLNFCGQVCEWNIVSGLRTGYFHDDSMEEDLEIVSERIEFDRYHQQPLIELAKEFVHNLEAMAPTERRELLDLLQRNVQIDSMSGEEFWRKFGIAELSYSRSKSLMGLRILWYHLKRFLPWTRS